MSRVPVGADMELPADAGSPREGSSREAPLRARRDPSPRAVPRSDVPSLTLHEDAIAANVAHFASLAPRLMAVVKADGFGHGAVRVARLAMTHGAHGLGVATIAEALELRQAGITAPTLAWMGASLEAYEQAIASDVSVAASSPSQVDEIAAAARARGLRARLHLFVDAAMAREGCPAEEVAALIGQAARHQREGSVRVVGIMGHLACAHDPDHPANVVGLTQVDHAADLARAAGLRPRWRHLAATRATLALPATHLDMVRVGAGLYGLDCPEGFGLRRALTLTAPLGEPHAVAPGTAVGYNHAYRTPHATRLGVVPLGYADGIPRAASGVADMYVRGRRCRVIGEVSMDQCVIDLGDAPAVRGDLVTVFGPGMQGEPTTADWARACATHEKDIVTGLGRRIVRV